MKTEKFLVNKKKLLIIIALISLPMKLWSADYFSNDIFEPDKTAFAWLILNYVDKDAKFHFLENGKQLDNAIPFDLPSAKYRRYPTCSTAMYVIKVHKIKDQKAIKLANCIDEIELDRWSGSKSEKATNIEKNLRRIFSNEKTNEKKLEASLKYISSIVDQL